ncbi:MAG: hypothetical protein RL385_2361 [Pseudomonadota bacterium]|jgi:hypothetical protein
MSAVWLLASACAFPREAAHFASDAGTDAGMESETAVPELEPDATGEASNDAAAEPAAPESKPDAASPEPVPFDGGSAYPDSAAATDGSVRAPTDARIERPGCAALRTLPGLPDGGFSCDDFEAADAASLPGLDDGIGCSPESCAGVTRIADGAFNHVLRSRLDNLTVRAVGSGWGGANLYTEVPASSNEIVAQFDAFGFPSNAAQSYFWFHAVNPDYSFILQAKWSASTADPAERCVLRMRRNDQSGLDDPAFDGPRFSAPPENVWTTVRLHILYDGEGYKASVAYDGVEKSQVSVKQPRASAPISFKFGLFSELAGVEADLSLDNVLIAY